ncbi:amino acid permease-domain-containing protein [Tribonema minus]|uniref:Amino acid permease-domain-containing protein n=1 Tax=Tribonema minus TaxID=303371 RepID=A0A835YRE6_9STRA|nr:amino acid permease-domain-containing protein [Tribonema minus]
MTLRRSQGVWLLIDDDRLQQRAAVSDASHHNCNYLNLDWRARSFDVSMDDPPGSKGRYNAVGNGSGSHHGSSRHGSQAEEGGSNHGHFHKKSLSFPALVVLIFYGVSGGPFGMEEAVAAGGPLLTLLGLVLLPLAWSIPEALVTAELSTAFPEASGFVAWVSAAFGPYWGFMEGYWSWLSGVADNSLYAVLILDYVLRLLDPDSPLMEGLPRAAFLLATCALLTMLNLRGLQFVGRTAILVCVFSLLPFIIMSCWGLKGYQYPSNWLDLPAGGLQAVEWGTLLNVMFWNLNYWDSAASFAGEVDNPGRAFPRAMACCIVLVVLSGALPILAGTGVSANPDYALWEDGYFEAAATAVGGPWLGLWVVIAAAVSNVGLFEAEMSSDSMQLMGMADRGMVPKVLGRRTKSGSPLVATLLSATGVLLLGFLSFSAIVEILNSLYVFAELLEFAAFIKLRMDRPDLPRPFRVPLSTTGCIVML